MKVAGTGRTTLRFLRKFAPQGVATPVFLAPETPSQDKVEAREGGAECNGDNSLPAIPDATPQLPEVDIDAGMEDDFAAPMTETEEEGIPRRSCRQRKAATYYEPETGKWVSR